MGRPRSGYKIVQQITDTDLRSLISYLSHGKWNCGSVKYVINQWSYPEKGCGPLCVFRTFSEAVDLHDLLFKHRDGTYPIFTCHYYPSDEQHIYRADLVIRPCLAALSSGTILATKVKLIERVE